MKTQLLLNFEEAVSNYRKAGDEVVKATEALIQQTTKKEAKKTIETVDAESLALREKLNTLVRVHARHKKLHWREIWRVAYERLRVETGFDAVVKGLSKNIRPLDAVIKYGKGARLLRVVESL